MDGWVHGGKANFTFGRIPKLQDIPYKSSMYGVDNYTNVGPYGDGKVRYFGGA